MKKLLFTLAILSAGAAQANWHYRVANGLPIEIDVNTTRKGSIVAGEPSYKVFMYSVGPDRNYTEKKADKNAVLMTITSPIDPNLKLEVTGPEYDAIIHVYLNSRGEYAYKVQRVNLPGSKENDTWR